MLKDVKNYGLSSREKEVLKFLVKGFSNPKIAKNMLISESTVKAHVSSIFRKINVKNRIEAVVIAVTKNLIQ